MLRIPASVTFPFKYRITIKQLSNHEFDIHAPDCDGLWLADSRTILIRKALPIKRRTYLLAHELGHAWLDWQHVHLDSNTARP